MKNAFDSQLAEQLVSTFTELSSTEELIFFVAGKAEMLPFCQRLLEQFDLGESTQLVQLVNTLCSAKGVLPGSLYEEIRKVLLALNKFYDADRDHYEVLGLPSDASVDTVKKAYRDLSKKFHPDRNEHMGSSPDKFLEISGAYHAIMAAASRKVASNKTRWRKKRPDRNMQKNRARKKFLVTVLILVAVLTAASIYVAEQYNNKVIIRQLHTSTPSPTQPAKQPDTEGQVKVATTLEEPVITLSETRPEFLETSTPQSPTQHEKPQQLAVEDILSNMYSSAPSQEEIPAIPESSEDTSDQSTDAPHQDQPDENISNPEFLTPPSPAAPAPEPEKAINQETTPSIPSPAPTVTVAVSHSEHVEKKKPAKNEDADRQEVNEKPNDDLTADLNTEAAPQEELQAQPLNVQPGEQYTKEQRIHTINTTLEISALLKEYSKLYNRKDLEPFLALFSKSATENGHALANEVDQYRSLFEHTSEIDLNIENVSWTDDNDGLTARAQFVSSYTYHDGSRKEYTGDISFLLVTELGTLKIQSLNYVFQ